MCCFALKNGQGNGSKLSPKYLNMTSFGCQKFVYALKFHWKKAFLEQENMSSESETSDYSQTLSKPENREMEEEEEDNVQVIHSQIEP